MSGNLSIISRIKCSTPLHLEKIFRKINLHHWNQTFRVYLHVVTTNRAKAPAGRSREGVKLIFSEREREGGRIRPNYLTCKKSFCIIPENIHTFHIEQLCAEVLSTPQEISVLYRFILCNPWLPKSANWHTSSWLCEYFRDFWIIDFLMERKQRIKLTHNCFSEWEAVPAGVPQGMKRSPWLFLLMINDLSVTDTILWKYVDDTILVESVPKNETSYMQLRVDVLVWQSEADGFLINKYLVFQPRQKFILIYILLSN